MGRRKFFLQIKFGEISAVLRKLLVFVMFLGALLFVFMSKFSSNMVDKMSATMLEITAPVAHVLEFPARGIHHVYTYLYDVSHIFSDNRILREENQQMQFLQNKVRTLEVENQLLSRLLNYIPPPEVNFFSAKIVAESGDEYTHALVVYVGHNTVKKGQVVLGNESVIGRVDKVSGNYAKILLLTDINSNIPVVIERTRARGILSGDNTENPQIIFTRPEDDIREGDLVVTSGVGGMFPSGLPIGFINSMQNGEIKVETIADISRVEYVRIVNYGPFTDEAELEDFMKADEDGR